MGDLQTYISKRKARDPEFAKDFETGYQEFKNGAWKQKRAAILMLHRYPANP
jgi:hypothetical protein